MVMLPSIPDPGDTPESLRKAFRQVVVLLRAAGLDGAQALPWASESQAVLPGIRECVPSNSTGDATNDLNFTEGWIVDSEGFSWHQPAFNELGLDRAFSQGHNGGLLDAPQTAAGVGNNTYHIFALYSETTGKAAYVAGRQTTPVLPSDYNRYARVFSLKRGAGANQLFTAYEMPGGGLYVELLVPVRDFTTANPGTSAVVWTTSAPLGVKFMINGNFWAFSTGAASRNILVTSPDQTDTAPSGSLRHLSAIIGATNAAPSQNIRRMSSTTATLRYRTDSSDANLTVEGITNGWVDRRVL